jgi:hypothetical protein
MLIIKKARSSNPAQFETFKKRWMKIRRFLFAALSVNIFRFSLICDAVLAVGVTEVAEFVRLAKFAGAMR